MWRLLVKEKLLKIMASVLELDESMIDSSTSPETVAEWDSLRHMKLVVALEEEFEVEFTDDQITEMLSPELILVTLNEAGASAG